MKDALAWAVLVTTTLGLLSWLAYKSKRYRWRAPWLVINVALALLTMLFTVARMCLP